MPTNTTIIAHDGEFLTITFQSFIITIPAPEGAILWEGEPLPRIIDLDNCKDGFDLHDTDHRLILSYKLNRQDDVASLESPAEVVEREETVNDTDRVNEEDKQRGQRNLTPARPASSNRELFLPFKTLPRPSSLAKPSPAAASSPQAIYPITPPEGAPKPREVPIQNSVQKAMYASQRYEDPSSNIISSSLDNSTGNIDQKQHIPRSLSFTTPSQIPSTPRTPATMPRRSSTSATPMRSRATSLTFHRTPSSSGRAALLKQQSSPIFRTPWNIPGRRPQLTTSWKGTANLHIRSEENNVPTTLKENQIPTVNRRASRARTPSPSPRRGLGRGCGVELKGQMKRGSYTGMANYDRTGAWGRPGVGTKEEGGRDTSPFRGEMGTTRYASTHAFALGDLCGAKTIEHEIEMSQVGIKAAQFPTRGLSSSTPNNRKDVAASMAIPASPAKASNTKHPSPTNPSPQSSPSKKIRYPSDTTHNSPSLSSPARTTELKPHTHRPTHLTTTTPHLHHPHQPSKRALQISPSLPCNPTTLTATSTPSTLKMPLMKRRRSIAAATLHPSSEMCYPAVKPKGGFIAVDGRDEDGQERSG
ncbi:MAG: hypothetical protein L6R42_009179 [Xanthoria sp. 1 TBL-2021]|nr:MAG: hypothetical protein L6R42_009179 [Xanthoria sp. 1 TBL-2021]